MRIINKLKSSKYYFVLKFFFTLIILLLVVNFIFPHVEFVANRLIKYKLSNANEDKNFYESLMTFMGAMAAMLYLLYMMVVDEIKLNDVKQAILTITRRELVSSFLMLLFGMMCFTAVHVMPTDKAIMIQVVAYAGLLLLMLAFWYIVIAMIDLFYINWNETMHLKNTIKKSRKNDQK